MAIAFRLHAVRWGTFVLWMAGFWMGGGGMAGSPASAEGLGSHTHERIDRGLIARPMDGGRVVLSWRWLT